MREDLLSGGKSMKKLVAEAIGTFILVFIGTGGAVLSGESIGYLGIGCFRGLDYTHNPHKENVPCIFWRIENPTKYCKHGVKVYTYWQNYNETEKKNED